MKEKKLPLIVISGPTATGKTDISVLLAKKINGEIISADSMQVYKYMNIGTAKPTQQEMGGVKHYLIDEIYPDEDFSVMLFQKKAKNYIEEICAKGKLPILTGGTGFYINSVLYNNEFAETDADPEYRQEMYALAAEYGNEVLYEKLKAIDPESAEAIHFNNVKRVVRALEFYKQTKTKISQHNALEKTRELNYDISYIVLNMDRNKLYNRINQRVDKMIEYGLVDEVENLMQMGYNENLVSMQGIGYKETICFIKGNQTINAAIDEIKQSTRHFAKRQMTWFRHQVPNNLCKLLNIDEINNKGIIVEELIRLVHMKNIH